MKFSSGYLSRIALVIFPQALLLSLMAWAIASVAWKSPAPALFSAYWLCVFAVSITLDDFIRTRPYPFRLCVLRKTDGMLCANNVPVDMTAIRSVRSILGYIPSLKGMVMYVRFFEITLERPLLISGEYTNRIHGLARITWPEIACRRGTGPRDLRLYKFLLSLGLEEEKILPEQRVSYKKLSSQAP